MSWCEQPFIRVPYPPIPPFLPASVTFQGRHLVEVVERMTKTNLAPAHHIIAMALPAGLDPETQVGTGGAWGEGVAGPCVFRVICWCRLMQRTNCAHAAPRTPPAACQQICVCKFPCLFP